jgi:hypothetical protein
VILIGGPSYCFCIRVRYQPVSASHKDRKLVPNTELHACCAFCISLTFAIIPKRATANTGSSKSLGSVESIGLHMLI